MPRATHVQLTANTVATVTLDADYQNVEVVNRDGSGEVFFTYDGSTPTVAGDGTVLLPAALSGVTVNPETAPVSVIKLISAGTPKVSVRGW